MGKEATGPVLTFQFRGVYRIQRHHQCIVENRCNFGLNLECSGMGRMQRYEGADCASLHRAVSARVGAPEASSLAAWAGQGFHLSRPGWGSAWVLTWVPTAMVNTCYLQLGSLSPSIRILFVSCIIPS